MVTLAQRGRDILQWIRGTYPFPSRNASRVYLSALQLMTREANGRQCKTDAILLLDCGLNSSTLLFCVFPFLHLLLKLLTTVQIEIATSCDAGHP